MCISVDMYARMPILCMYVCMYAYIVYVCMYVLPILCTYVCVGLEFGHVVLVVNLPLVVPLFSST